LVSLNHFTVPCSAILLLLACCSCRPEVLAGRSTADKKKIPRGKNWRPPACAFYARLFTKSVAMRVSNPDRSPARIHG
jgi:hypothetical protein